MTSFPYPAPRFNDQRILEGSYKHYAQSRSPKILASRRHTLFIRCIGDGDMAAREEVGVCRYARFLDTREIEIPPSSDMVDSNCIPGLTPFDHRVLASRYRSLQLR